MVRSGGRTGRRRWQTGLIACAVLALLVTGTAHAEPVIVRVPLQYIAALGDPMATSGNDAHTWGIWYVDPGPRGVQIAEFSTLEQNDGLAPAGWRFDRTGWWVEERGFIMESPFFPISAGQYVVTGGREAVAILTVEAPADDGTQAWSLSDGASVYDVTHLGCRAAFYTPADDNADCSPDQAPVSVFPMTPETQMPHVPGCNKQDYHVLVIVGLVIEG